MTAISDRGEGRRRRRRCPRPETGSRRRLATRPAPRLGIPLPPTGAARDACFAGAQPANGDRCRSLVCPPLCDTLPRKTSRRGPEPSCTSRSRRRRHRTEASRMGVCGIGRRQSSTGTFRPPCPVAMWSALVQDIAGDRVPADRVGRTPFSRYSISAESGPPGNAGDHVAGVPAALGGQVLVPPRAGANRSVTWWTQQHVEQPSFGRRTSGKVAAMALALRAWSDPSTGTRILLNIARLLSTR